MASERFGKIHRLGPYSDISGDSWGDVGLPSSRYGYLQHAVARGHGHRAYIRISRQRHPLSRFTEPHRPERCTPPLGRQLRGTLVAYDQGAAFKTDPDIPQPMSPRINFYLVAGRRLYLFNVETRCYPGQPPSTSRSEGNIRVIPHYRPRPILGRAMGDVLIKPI